MAEVVVRYLGRQPYGPIFERMKTFTAERDKETKDEIWLLEHEPVFTQGQAGKAEHLINTGNIPVVQVDRGGQVTYHGPGQLVGYLMLDVKRLNYGVRQLVSLIEESIVATLSQYQIESAPKADAPGVYVNGAKIASLGLRIRKGCSYHGLALNVNMDLEPWHRINPCGYPGLQMVQVSDFAPEIGLDRVQKQLQEYLTEKLGYNTVTVTSSWD